MNEGVFADPHRHYEDDNSESESLLVRSPADEQSYLTQADLSNLPQQPRRNARAAERSSSMQLFRCRIPILDELRLYSGAKLRADVVRGRCGAF